MRPKISKTNVTYFIRQEYGFTSLKQFFQKTKNHPSLKSKVLNHVVSVFTNYNLHDEKLLTFNPYTSKSETLNISNFNHISNNTELFKDLSMLHKTRMRMLEQSRVRILELSKEKKNDRDVDLQDKQTKIQQKRQYEIQKFNPRLTNKRERDK